MSASNSGLPPSGSWSGYYLYGWDGAKHHMKMFLAFTADGKISGDGIDDVGPFTIAGSFNSASNEAAWTKSYIGRHRVQYSGLYDRRSICGNWTLVVATGGFWIWPDSIAQGEGAEAEVEQPVEAALTRSS